MNKKIGIIHSNNLFKYGLKLLLSENSYEVNTQVQMPLKERFDILFIEYTYLNEGLRQLQEIKTLYPYCKILILIDNIESDTLKSLMELGVNGILTQDLSEDFILQMFDFVYNNGFVMSGEVYKMLKKSHFLATSPIKMTRNQFKSYHSNLTQREYEVLKLLVEGKSNLQIAQTLTISEHTAKAHVCNIIQKLVVDDRTQAVIKAIKEGIV